MTNSNPTTEKFKALVARTDDDGKLSAAVEDADSALLAEGDATVRVQWSGINYKDALAVSGKGKILRGSPLIPGIDFAGTLAADAGGMSAGTAVVLTGRGVGEKYSGGFSQFARTKSAWLLPLPQNINARQAMLCGTAGITAALCVLALHESGHVKEGGKIAVSGASGGVGSFAVRLLAKLGYQVFAVSRPAAAEYLKKAGAADILPREEMSAPCRPLEKSRWDGAVDTVGGAILARLLAETEYGGVVAACGLAASHKLETTVMPFILRGVRLDGVDSVMIPDSLRARAWQLLAETLADEDYAAVENSAVGLDGIVAAADKVLSGELNGRILVSPDGGV
ncbi:MAG: acryloyl-CoA reductase [Betaproteobacteria bacterium]|nr:acryloyl-CoA reductase [Betaproteobacteria bacterium]